MFPHSFFTVTYKRVPLCPTNFGVDNFCFFNIFPLTAVSWILCAGNCHGHPVDDYVRNWQTQHNANNQTLRVYDERGYSTGRLEVDSQTVRFYDNNGYNTGRAKPTFGGGYDYYNSSGYRQGYWR